MKLEGWIKETRKIYIEEYDYSETAAQLDTAIIIIKHLFKAIRQCAALGRYENEGLVTYTISGEVAQKAIEACEKEIS